jgi:uncharacterized protein (TIGR01777 family)
MVRDEPRAKQQFGPDVRCYPWDAASPPPEAAFQDVKVVFHLVGESVAEGRWTRQKRQRIRESRILATRQLVSVIGDLSVPPEVLVCASAVGYYGDRPAERLTEEAAPGRGFLSEVCRDWEAAAMGAAARGIRVVTLRIGMVLSGSGGALTKMLPLFRSGLGGPMGRGHQMVSWIHIDDLVGLLHHAAVCESLTGPVNAVAPGPVANRVFARSLARVLHRPAVLPVPKLALRLALGDAATLVLADQHVLPQRAVETGFRFTFADIDSALDDLI